MTGAPVPEGADAVVPIEWTSASGSEVSIEPRTIRPEQNVLRKGHVRRAGSLLVRAGTRLRPQEIGSLAEAGHAIVPAYRRPRVAIVPTGDELVPIDEVPGPGQIRNSNEVMLTAQIQSYGADALPLGIARDNAEHLQALIQEGLKADVLILSGGVSAGQLDLVPQELKRAGVEQVFHKIRLRPGKPLWFGVRPAGATAGAANPCYVFGLPGNPVSSMVCCELFVRTALGWLSGDSAAKFEQVAARLAETATNPTDRPTMHPARLSAEAGQLSVQVMEWKGSADLHALVEANALAAMPAGPTTLEAGETIPVIPLAGSKPW